MVFVTLLLHVISRCDEFIVLMIIVTKQSDCYCSFTLCHDLSPKRKNLL